VFVFCADQEKNQKNLFQGIYELVHSVKEYPKNLSVIPMSFQKEDVIAPLFYRTDISLTRSGGQTAMELMSVSKAQIWIHSEAKKQGSPISDEDLLKGIPGWEAGNACYLRDKLGAKIVTPHTFAEYIKPAVTSKVDY